MDRLFYCVEVRGDSHGDAVSVPSMDCMSSAEISRQLWALMGPLVAADSALRTVFRAQHHNGLEVWRRVSGPIREDPTLIRRYLLLLNESRSLVDRRSGSGAGGLGHQPSVFPGGQW